MSRKGENIYRRSDGRWEARYISGYDEITGKARYASIYAATYREARERRAVAAVRGRKAEERQNAITVEECFVRWLRWRASDPDMRVSTLEQYRRHIEKHIDPILGSVPLRRLTMGMLDEFRAEKLRSGRLDGRGGLSASVVETIMLICFHMLRYAAEEGYIAEPPRRRTAKSHRAGKREARVLSVDEQRSLEEQLCEGFGADPCSGLYMGIFFALYTGLRVGELSGLQWRDVDFHTGRINVRRTVQRLNPCGSGSGSRGLHVGPPKSKKSQRTIPIKSELMLILKRYYEQLPRCRKGETEPVFVHRGKLIEPRTYQYHFKKLLEKARIQDANFHCLRHTFATRCIENNMDVQSLSEYLGHSSGSITMQIYVHSFAEHKKACVNRLNFLCAAPQISSIRRQIFWSKEKGTLENKDSEGDLVKSYI